MCYYVSGMVPTHLLRVNLFTSSISGIPENETTFAEMAKEEGYKTALIGIVSFSVIYYFSF